MKGHFKVIGWALILSIAVTLVHTAPAEKEHPAEKELPADTAESGSKTESSSSSQEPVPVPNSADTRADPPAGTSAVPVSKPTATVGTFFDNIFNIPTSVLRAVNQFLNNNIKIGQGQSSKTAGPASAHAPAAAPVAPNAPDAPATSASAPSDGQTEAPKPADNTPAAAGGTPHKPAARSSFFDNIFNIPISAINSVNSLITGRKFGENEEKSPSHHNF